MKVLHLNQSYIIRGGTEVYIHQLQNLLPQYNVSTFFIAVSDSKVINRFDLISKDVILKHRTKKEVEQFLSSFIKANKIDIIHVHSVSNKNLVKFCLENKPVIRSIHEPRMFCPGRQKFLLKSETICEKPFGLHCCIDAYTEGCQDSRIPSEVIRSYANSKFEIYYAAKRYKRIVVMSDYIKKEAMLAGISGKNILVNPCFTPFVQLSEETLLKNQVKKHIVFVGRLHPSKGIHTLIRALSNILKYQNYVFLDIIGEGLFKNELIKLISMENIPIEKIIFHGWMTHSDTLKKIKDSYLVVFPSIYPEAFGIVGIEAMMHAKPVVAFNVGGVSTWLQNDVTGFLVDVKDENATEEKVNILLNNDELYKQFSLNARKNAIEKFIPEVHLSALVELYKSLLN